MRQASVFALALLVAGCGGAKTAKQQGHDGHWVIVGHHIPGVAGMSEEKALEWHGKAIDLSPEWAIAGTDTCMRPQYRDYTVSADSLLTIGFKAAPGSVGPTLPPGGVVPITQITCEGETWYAPGALLIWTSSHTALTPWEGVFFELERR
jgi:hypothetical protein